VLEVFLFSGVQVGVQKKRSEGTLAFLFAMQAKTFDFFGNCPKFQTLEMIVKGAAAY
jgi:hypothetical protein